MIDSLLTIGNLPSTFLDCVEDLENQDGKTVLVLSGTISTAFIGVLDRINR